MAHASPRRSRGRMKGVRRSVLLAAVATLAAAIAVTAIVLRTSAGHAAPCQRAFVPAYFYESATWARAAGTTPPPAYMILDISGLGSGSAPDRHFQAVVRQAREAGVQILGYSSTAGGSRPAAQVEADVRHYRAWYGVRNILLDVVSGTQADLPYYQQLARYIRHTDPGSALWLNPGLYPAQSYMSLANVVVAFEGHFSQYVTASVPRWARSYPADRFAATIYGTAGSQLGSAVDLARSRNTGYLYVTDGTGANPYDALPSYWSQEVSLTAASCSGH